MNKRSLLFALILICAFARTSRAQVSSEQLEHAAHSPQNWLTYSGDYSGNATASCSRSIPPTYRGWRRPGCFNPKSQESSKRRLSS